MRGFITRTIPSLSPAHSGFKWWVLGNIMISTFMAVLDATIVNTALPKVMSSFGISVEVAQWILTAYMLAYAIMLPTSGWIADRFGYKRTYATGLFVFTLFSFLCGISWNEYSLIAMRIGQGLGGGLLQPIGMAVILREFPYEKRGLALGFWSIAAAASVSLGPMLGGYLVDNFDWHIIFTINVPVGIFCLLATWIIQREYKARQNHPFDFVGFLSVAVFLGFLLFALASGNAQWNTGGWTSDLMMLCYGLALTGLVTFLVIELNVAHPLINLRLLGRFNFGFTNLVIFIFGIGMFGSTFLMPLYLQDILGYTALQSGMVFLPVGILQAGVSPIAGFLSDKINPKIPIIGGIILFSISFYLNTKLTIYSEHAQIMLPLYLRGLSMGMLFTPLSSLAMRDIRIPEMAQASGLTNVTRQVGGSFGVAILQMLLAQRLTYHTVICGAALNAKSPLFQQCLQQLRFHAVHDAGQSMLHAVSQASMLFSMHFSKQMFVTAINDDFLFSSICTLLCIIPVLMLRGKRSGKATG